MKISCEARPDRAAGLLVRAETCEGSDFILNPIRLLRGVLRADEIADDTLLVVFEESLKTAEGEPGRWLHDAVAAVKHVTRVFWIEAGSRHHSHYVVLKPIDDGLLAIARDAERIPPEILKSPVLPTGYQVEQFRAGTLAARRIRDAAHDLAWGKKS